MKVDCRSVLLQAPPREINVFIFFFRASFFLIFTRALRSIPTRRYAQREEDDEEDTVTLLFFNGREVVKGCVFSVLPSVIRRSP